jgi:hypothetical protein
MSYKKKSNGKRGPRKVLKVSEATTEKEVETLILFGRNYPSVPGMVKSANPTMPTAVRVVLKYHFTVTQTASAGEVDTYLFRGNGMFDPDVTGVGAQPLGFDQWHTLYQQNRVLASTIKATLTTPDATTNDALSINFCVYPSQGTSTPTTFESGASNPYARSKAVNGVIPRGQAIVNSMETSTMLGLPKVGPLVDDQLDGTNLADPAELWYWVLMMQPLDAAAATGYRLTGVVSYLCDFFQPNVITLSAESPQHKEHNVEKALRLAKSKRISASVVRK